MRRLVIAVVAVAVLALGGGRLVGALRGSEQARVVRVVDGDTLVGIVDDEDILRVVVAEEATA